MHKGRIVSIAGRNVTVRHDDGSTDTHEVAADAAVTLNGKPSKLEDLKAGDAVSISGSPASTVTATR